MILTVFMRFTCMCSQLVYPVYLLFIVGLWARQIEERLYDIMLTYCHMDPLGLDHSFNRTMYTLLSTVHLV